MDGNVWRPAHLTPEQMEERRLAAAALLREGRLSQADIARQLGVSCASVCRWAASLARQGRRGLEARPIPGRAPRLGEKAWARLGRLLDRGACERVGAPGAADSGSTLPCGNRGGSRGLPHDGQASGGNRLGQHRNRAAARPELRPARRGGAQHSERR